MDPSACELHVCHSLCVVLILCSICWTAKVENSLKKDNFLRLSCIFRRHCDKSSLSAAGLPLNRQVFTENDASGG